MYILPEILNIIFSYLDYDDYSNIYSVNKHWENVANLSKIKEDPKFVVFMCKYPTFKNVLLNDLSIIIMRADLHTSIDNRLLSILVECVELEEPMININNLTLIKSINQLQEIILLLIHKPSHSLYSLLTNIIELYNNAF